MALLICKFHWAFYLGQNFNLIFMLYIGQQLRSKRNERNWKQQYVAERTGIPQTALSRIENNQQGASEEEIQKLATIFDTTAEELKASVVPHVNMHNNSIKGNGYVHQQTNNGVEALQQVIEQVKEVTQQMSGIVQELHADRAHLREENRQLRQRDEKWMQMLMEMHKHNW